MILRTSIVLLAFLSLPLMAQKGYKSLKENYVLDSLSMALRAADDDSLRCIINHKIAREYLKKGDKQNFSSYYAKAKLLTGKNEFLRDYAAYNYSGFYYLDNNYEAYMKQLIYAEKKLRKYRIPEVYKIRAGILFNKSIYNQKLSSKEAMKILTGEALPIAKKATDFEMVVMIYKSISVILFNEKQETKANYYIEQAIQTYLQNKVQNTELLISSYLLQAEILLELEKYEAAYAAIDKANEILKQYPNSDYQITLSFTLGSYFHHTKSYPLALRNFDKTIAKARAIGDDFMVNRSNLMKVLTLKEMGNYTEAKKILLALYARKDVYPEDKIDYLNELAFIYKKLGDLPKSVATYEQYIKSSDSLKEVKYKEELQHLEAAFHQLETKERLNKLDFEKKNALQEARNNQLKFAVVLLVSVILVLVILYFWLKYIRQKKLNQERETALNLKINSLKNENELVSLYAMMEGEENERKRIARDLHDGLGSSLSSIKMRVAQIANESEQEKEMQQIYHLLDNAVKELRQVAYNLIPETLLKLGLDQALNDLCFAYGSEQVTITYQGSQIGNNILKSHQITIYRIVQELIYNAVKHSKGSHIIVDCSQNQNLFLITVEDNGKGFDPDILENSKGIGLRSIKTRVELLNGKMEITSNEEGTTINIELFIKTEA